MRTKFFKKIVTAALTGVMAMSLIPAAAINVSAASDSTVIGVGSSGIYNANLYQYVLNHYDANKDGKLTVGEAKNVTTINIVNQKVTSLKGIYWFPNLESLTIQNCGLSSVHADIGKLTNLKNLNLSYNKISKLPTAVGSLKNLVTVDLSGNKLTALPINAKYWTKVTSLDLSNNAFAQISTGSMPYMKTLTYLNLSGNKLTNSNSTIRAKMNKLSSLTKLTVLDLSDNQLTQFPSAVVYKLTKLEELYLDNNKITSVSKYIGYLTKLTVLDLSDNNITSVNSAISKCTKLTKLDLSNNKLSTIPSLKALTKLKCTSTDYYALNLCGNKLSQSAIRSKTNSVLTSAWVKRQTTKTFVPISSINAKTTFVISGMSADMSNQYTINPSGATYTNVKCAIENVSEGVKATLDGSSLTVTKTDSEITSGYVFVKVTSLDGSKAEALIYVQVV